MKKIMTRKMKKDDDSEFRVNIKEMLTRLGFKIEASHELNMTRKQRDKMEHLFLSAHKQCTELIDHLGKAEDHIGKHDEQYELLTAQLKEAKDGEDLWRKKFFDKQEEIDTLRKQMKEMHTSLSKQVKDAKEEENNWRKKYYNERKEINVMRKRIDLLIHPPSRQPSRIVSNMRFSSPESSCFDSWEEKQLINVSEETVVLKESGQTSPQHKR